MSTEKYATASLVIPIVKTRNWTNQTNNPYRISCIKRSVKRLSKKIATLEENLFLAKTTILDPRFKKLHFSTPLAADKAISDLPKKITTEHKIRANISLAVGASPCRINVISMGQTWAYAFENMSNEIAGLLGTTPDELKQYLDQPNI